MRKTITSLLLSFLLMVTLTGCRRHVYQTYYGVIDTDTMSIATYDLRDSFPCYLVSVSDRDSVEVFPGEWEIIYGPIHYYYCPRKDVYYETFPDNQGNSIFMGYNPYSNELINPSEI